MKKLFVSLVLCVITDVSLSQSLYSIVKAPWNCLEGEPSVSTLCVRPNQALIQYEAYWSDTLPKKISVTFNGDDDVAIWTTIYEQGLGVIAATYYPPMPDPPQTSEPGFVLGLHTLSGVRLAHTEEADPPNFALVRRPPQIFDLESVDSWIEGDTSVFTVYVSADDWDLSDSQYNDCGHRETSLRVELFDCVTYTVYDSDSAMQSTSTTNDYSFTLKYAGPFTDVKVRVKLVHTEENVDGPFGPSISGLVAQTQSDCFQAGDLSTNMDESGQTAQSPLLPYPVPFSETLTLKGANPKAPLNITDVAGHIVWTGTVPADLTVKGLSYLPSGVYVVTTGTSRSSITKL